MFRLVTFSVLNISIEKNKSKFFLMPARFPVFLQVPPEAGKYRQFQQFKRDVASYRFEMRDIEIHATGEVHQFSREDLFIIQNTLL